MNETQYITDEQLKAIGHRFGNFTDDYLATAGRLFLDEARRQIADYGTSKWMRPADWCIALEADYPDQFKEDIQAQ